MSEPGGRRRGKAPRAPIRHGRRRRREREEKVSRAAAFPGAGLFCLRSPPVSPPPPPSLARRAPPRSTSPSWRGGWESRAQRSAGLGSPPRTPAPRRRSPSCPARLSGRAGQGRVRPSRFRAFPPPLSSAVAAISRPRADPARAASFLGSRPTRGSHPRAAWLSRGRRRRLCTLGSCSGGPKMLTF